MFSGTGGTEGIKIFTDISWKLRKEILFARNITPCCSEEIMGRALRLYRKKIIKADVLVVLSCASGVKAANISRLPIPVISVLNPIGSVVVGSGKSKSSLLDSVCTICGNCVLSYTSGICPVHECPARSIYQPCKKASLGGGDCAINPERKCVWADIFEHGNPEALLALQDIHRRKTKTLITPGRIRHTKTFIRWPVSMLLSAAQVCEKCVKWIQ